MDGTSASRLTRPLNPGGRLERLSDISARSEPVSRELPGSLRVFDGKGSDASFSTIPPVGALGARRDSNPLPLGQSAQVSDLALRSPCPASQSTVSDIVDLRSFRGVLGLPSTSTSPRRANQVGGRQFPDPRRRASYHTEGTLVLVASE